MRIAKLLKTVCRTESVPIHSMTIIAWLLVNVFRFFVVFAVCELAPQVLRQQKPFHLTTTKVRAYKNIYSPIFPLFMLVMNCQGQDQNQNSRKKKEPNFFFGDRKYHMRE